MVIISSLELAGVRRMGRQIVSSMGVSLSGLESKTPLCNMVAKMGSKIVVGTNAGPIRLLHVAHKMVASLFGTWML